MVFAVMVVVGVIVYAAREDGIKEERRREIAHHHDCEGCRSHLKKEQEL